MTKAIQYSLITPFKYAHAGKEEEASFIEMSPPTSRNIVDSSYLKQAFSRATAKAGDDAPIDKDKKMPELTGEDVLIMFAMSDDVDLSKILLTAKELFTSGLCLVDGSEKLTKPLIDEITIEDLEAMTGEYMINFTLASLLRKMKSSL